MKTIGKNMNVTNNNTFESSQTVVNNTLQENCNESDKSKDDETVRWNKKVFIG